MRAYRLCLMAGVAALALSLSASVAFSQVVSSEDGVIVGDAASEIYGSEMVYGSYGYAGYGYTPYGFRRLAPRTLGGYYFPQVPQQCPPYTQSYYQYSPTRYGTDPCCQWTFRGCFLHIPVWEYTPQLIPPRPHADYHCCHNSGLCTPEMPCCPLCNINGCCDRERAIEAGEDFVPASKQNPTLAPVPTTSAKTSDDPEPADAPEEPVDAQDEPVDTQDEPADAPEEPAANATEDEPNPDALLDSVNASKVKTSQVSWSMPNQDGTQSNRLSNIDVRSSRGVIFTIWAPNQAKVYVNGTPTKSIGSKRTFASINLKPGLKYQYVIDAVVEKDGKTYSESKTITVSAGDVKTVAFAFPELNVIPSDEWSGEGF